MFFEMFEPLGGDCVGDGFFGVAELLSGFSPVEGEDAGGVGFGCVDEFDGLSG